MYIRGSADCMHQAHEDGMHLLSAVLPLTSPFPSYPSPSRANRWWSRWTDTSCMSPSCKRGVTRLTSIVLVDGHAYRGMDRWAGDDKGTARGHRDGHAPRCSGSHRRYHRIGCLAITHGLDSGCAILNWTRHFFLSPFLPRFEKTGKMWIAIQQISQKRWERMGFGSM